MQLGANADGALLQRALDGQPVDDPGIASLVTIARDVAALDTRGLDPRADFVEELRHLLLEVPAGAAGPPERRDPAVLRFGRRARMLLAAAAVLLVLAGAVGAISRSALPGDRLYPVKQVLDRVVIELHREPLGLGRAYLDQAREHVEEAEQLIASRDATASGADSAELTADAAAGLARALDAATTSTTAADTVLLGAYRSEQRVDALTSLAEFHAGVVPAVDSLGEAPLPPMARTAWQRLHDELDRGRDATLRELAACAPCGEASAAARALLAREGTAPRAPGATASSTGTPGPGRPAAPGSPSLQTSARPDDRPAASPTGSPTSQGPSSPRRTPGAGQSASSPAGGGARPPSTRVPSVTVEPGRGGVTPPVPVPSLTLPDVGVTTSDITVGGGQVTLPGATVSLPTITLPLPQPPR
jgi:hypothetical protein